MSRTTRRVLLLVGAVLVALTAVGAAMSSTRNVEQVDRAVGTTTSAPPPPGPEVTTTSRHEFPAAYEGPVWLTVAVADGREHQVEIVWGPWRKVVRQSRPGPVSYWFKKGSDPEDDPAPPVDVRADGGVTVSLGNGPELPPGAVDINEGWTAVPIETAVTPGTTP